MNNTRLTPSPLETLKRMVATDDPKERIRIYKAAQMMDFDFDKMFRTMRGEQ